MIPLDSSRWAELSHAYGPASDIPALLAELASFPKAEFNKDPWHSLWSALAHQGDVYPASFAAVPHFVALISSDPKRVNPSYFNFVAWVEICRHKQSAEIPPDLKADYFAALTRLPALISACAAREWNEDFTRCALAALAAAKGHVDLANAALELAPDVLSEFQEWLEERSAGALELRIFLPNRIGAVPVRSAIDLPAA